MSVALLLTLLLMPQSGDAAAPLREKVEPLGQESRPLQGAPLERLIADLGDDDVRGNAKAACEELLARPLDEVRGRPRPGASGNAPTGLSAALDDDDPQRRFLAAWVLAFQLGNSGAVQAPELGERVTRTLIPHLGEDAVRRNGLMAGEALRMLGQFATPYMVAARQKGHGQLARAIDYQIDAHAAWRHNASWGVRRRGPIFYLGPASVEEWAFPSASVPLLTVEERVTYLRGQLRDDDVRLNAGSARFELRVLLRGEAPHALVAALDDWDHQARQFAAQGLRWDEREFPPLRLYDVALEGLADDGLHEQDGVASAKESMLYLGRNYDLTRRWVMAGLDSRDAVIRYRSALVAAWAGERDLRTFAPVLIEHLADNDIVADAMGAVDALVAQGDAVRTLVQESLPSSDAQEDRLLRQVLRAIDRAGGRYTVPDTFPRGIDPGLGYRE